VLLGRGRKQSTRRRNSVSAASRILLDVARASNTAIISPAMAVAPVLQSSERSLVPGGTVNCTLAIITYCTPEWQLKRTAQIIKVPSSDEPPALPIAALNSDGDVGGAYNNFNFIDDVQGTTVVAS
jgi:hypothetical protein